MGHAQDCEELDNQRDLIRDEVRKWAERELMPLLRTELATVLRRELDRRPEGWEAYAKACVAYFDYWAEHTDDAWNEIESCRLFDAAEKARPSHAP